MDRAWARTQEGDGEREGGEAHSGRRDAAAWSLEVGDERKRIMEGITSTTGKLIMLLIFLFINRTFSLSSAVAH